MRRIIAGFLFFAVILSCLFTPIFATTNHGGRAINSAYASLSAGDNAGELDLSYYVESLSNTSTFLGISQIEVYTINGNRYKTIIGNTGNGLIVRGAARINDTYTISCQPNTSYYCVVTFYSQETANSQTVTYTTNTVRSTPEYNK